ncbi:MAG: thermonuclease family protein [Chloroflexota bacterium]|nr:thermonuclease family protein [Chloroflexota bacterium]
MEFHGSLVAVTSDLDGIADYSGHRVEVRYVARAKMPARLTIAAEAEVNQKVKGKDRGQERPAKSGRGTHDDLARRTVAATLQPEGTFSASRREPGDPHTQHLLARHGMPDIRQIRERKKMRQIGWQSAVVRAVFATSRSARRRRAPSRRLLLLVCTLGAALAGLPASNAAAHSVDLDCSDFGFQAAAQDHKDVHAGDPDQLDDDDDGRACEDELPCPCDDATVAPHALAPTPVRPLPATVPARLPTRAEVVRVIDGDTLTVRPAVGETLTVRLVGVTAARRRCGGPNAVARMKALVFHNGIGRSVRLRTDPTEDREDRFGRTLAYVSVRGADLGRTLVSSGWASVDIFKDFVRATIYRRAQASAKAAGRGMWRRCGANDAAVRPNGPRCTPTCWT